jgi:hypothetical protein
MPDSRGSKELNASILSDTNLTHRIEFSLAGSNKILGTPLISMVGRQAGMRDWCGSQRAKKRRRA